MGGVVCCVFCLYALVALYYRLCLALSSRSPNPPRFRLHEQLIFSPAEDFFSQLNTEIRSRSSQFMQDQGINVQFLRRLSRNEFSVRRRL